MGQISKPVRDPVRIPGDDAPVARGPAALAELPRLPGEAPAAQDPRRLALERTLHSETFRRSQRLREFLHYVGTMALDGRAAEVSELSIGDAVFHRREHFNPQEDNIVRNTARALRQKLKEYAEGEGKCQALCIEMPKGSYVPVFVAAAASPPQGETRGWRGQPVVMLAAVALLGALLAGWLMLENRRLSRLAAIQPVTRTLLSALLEPRVPVHLLVSDGLYCDLTVAVGSMYPLEDYVDQKLFQPLESPNPAKVSQDFWQLIRRGNYTNVAGLVTELNTQF
ncbi:MAG: hypothetical protein MUF01_15790, partial [Bryobacterales bacterium]|nr:hypothetical protein [Bryobacterales bacterium]